MFKVGMSIDQKIGTVWEFTSDESDKEPLAIRFKTDGTKCKYCGCFQGIHKADCEWLKKLK